MEFSFDLDGSNLDEMAEIIEKAPINCVYIEYGKEKWYREGFCVTKEKIKEIIEEHKKYGLTRHGGSFSDMSTYKAITYEEALDELLEKLLKEE